MSSHPRRWGWPIAAAVVVLSIIGSIALVGLLQAQSRTGDSGPAARPEPAPVRPSGPTVHVAIGDDHRVVMPTRLRPGVHRFVVRSGGNAQFQVVRPYAGYTRAQAAADKADGFRAGAGDASALRRLEESVTLLGGVPSSYGEPGVMWLRLTPGTYWVLDVNVEHPTAADLTEVVVAGRPVAGSTESAQTVSASSVLDTTSGAAPLVLDATGTVTFTNDTAQSHVFSLVPLGPGERAAAERRATDQFGAGSTGVLGPGLSLTVGFDLYPGRYAVLVWWPDATTAGVPDVDTGARALRLR